MLSFQAARHVLACIALSALAALSWLGWDYVLSGCRDFNTTEPLALACVFAAKVPCRCMLLWAWLCSLFY